jgi:hypothetical protein
MILNPEIAIALSGAAMGLSLVALGTAGWQWNRNRRGPPAVEWKVQADELNAEVAGLRLIVEGANTKAETASQTAQNSMQSAAASARSAAESARGAAASAEAAKSVAELGRRAWVHATEFKLSLRTQPNENSNLDVWIANLGSTPARELKLATNFFLCDEPPTELQLKQRVNNVVLGPGISFSLSHFLRVSPSEAAALSTGRKLLVTCGHAEYRDIFGVARETRWCAAYEANAKGFVPAGEHNAST